MSSAAKSERSAPCACARAMSSATSGRMCARRRLEPPPSVPALCDHVLETAVPHVELEHALEECAEAQPGVFLLESRLCGAADLREDILEDGVDQLRFRGKAPVEGPDAHTRTTCDLLDGDVDAVGRECGARGLDDPVAVALGIAAQRPGLCSGARHSGSLPESGVVTPVGRRFRFVARPSGSLPAIEEGRTRDARSPCWFPCRGRSTSAALCGRGRAGRPVSAGSSTMSRVVRRRM